MPKEWKDKSPKEKSDAIKGFIAIILIIFFLWVFGVFSSGSDKNSNSNLPKFDSEVINIGNSLTMYKIINRNDYDWNNVEIIVNEYYSCWSKDILGPDDSITINAVTCKDFALNYDLVESLWIKSDEGAERFSLR